MGKASGIRHQASGKRISETIVAAALQLQRWKTKQALRRFRSLTPLDAGKIERLAERCSWHLDVGSNVPMPTMARMLARCHTSRRGVRLDLDSMLSADDFNLAHDVVGLQRHFDYGRGRCTSHFLPRFASRERAA